MDEPVDSDSTDEQPTERPVGRGAGGRRRRRQALIVVAAAVASAAVGVGIGRQLKSPADAASERQAPPASLITVPVERRALTSNLTVAGQIVYDQPTPVRLLGAVGESAGSNQVITRLPPRDTVVNEGDVLLEVSGRPVFAFQGLLPVFRALEPGSNGPDVQQLETSLERLGFSPGTLDQIYDEGTEKAIDALYEARGYTSEGPSEEQRKQLRDVRQRLADAEEALRKANDELRKGGSTATESQLLGARQNVARAEAALPVTQDAATRNNQTAAAAVTAATQLRDAARVKRDAAKVIADSAAQPGAINPASGEPFTSVEIAELQSTLADRDAELINADKAITDATNSQSDTKATGDREVAQARDSLALARAELADLTKPADVAPLQASVLQATKARDDAGVEVMTIEAAVGTKMPAGEFIFLPTVPTQVTDVSSEVGKTVSDVLLTVSSAATQISGRVSKNDADLLKVGSPVTIEVADFGIETTGTLGQIGGKQPASNDPNAPPTGGESGRIEVLVLPDDPTLLKDFVGSTARVRITVSSTEGEVLAVPLAALTVGPDGTSRVEVLRSAPRTTDSSGALVEETELVTVEVGLTAQGYSEIAPVSGELSEGDRVVVGVDGPSDGSTGLSGDGGSIDDTVPADVAPAEEVVPAEDAPAEGVAPAEIAPQVVQGDVATATTAVG